jgi:hypothetical protein
MIRSLANDLTFGLSKEQQVIERLKSHFGDETILKTEDKFCLYDAVGRDYKYEIKSRRNGKKAYPTTIIPCHKALPDTVFIFNFRDQLCFIHYDADLFKTFRTEMIYADRSNPTPPSLHFHIPIDLLKDISV